MIESELKCGLLHFMFSAILKFIESLLCVHSCTKRASVVLTTAFWGGCPLTNGETGSETVNHLPKTGKWQDLNLGLSNSSSTCVIVTGRRQSPLSMGHMFQGSQQMPEIVDSTEPYRYYDFPIYTYLLWSLTYILGK